MSKKTALALTAPKPLADSMRDANAALTEAIAQFLREQPRMNVSDITLRTDWDADAECCVTIGARITVEIKDLSYS